MKERGSDLTIFSPRAGFMAHHIGDFRFLDLGGVCNKTHPPRRETAAG